MKLGRQRTAASSRREEAAFGSSARRIPETHARERAAVGGAFAVETHLAAPLTKFTFSGGREEEETENFPDGDARSEAGDSGRDRLGARHRRPLRIVATGVTKLQRADNATVVINRITTPAGLHRARLWCMVPLQGTHHPYRATRRWPFGSRKEGYGLADSTNTTGKGGDTRHHPQVSPAMARCSGSTGAAEPFAAVDPGIMRVEAAAGASATDRRGAYRARRVVAEIADAGRRGAAGADRGVPRRSVSPRSAVKQAARSRCRLTTRASCRAPTPSYRIDLDGRGCRETSWAGVFLAAGEEHCVLKLRTDAQRRRLPQ